VSTRANSILSRQLLPASTAILATSATASFQALGVAAALPDIATDLGNVSLLPWVIASFLLASTLATVVAGPFIDAIGVSRMFRIGVILFAAMGLASAFAPTMEVLIVLRVLHGAGAGLLISVTTSAVSLVYPGHLTARAFAANATVWGVMGVAGPAVAAFILTFGSWEWIFYVGSLIAILALFAGWKVLPGPHGEAAGRFDATGSVLLTVVATATLLAVNALDRTSILWLAGAATSLFLYIRHARRAKSPVVRLEHIAVQPYSGLALSTALILTGTFSLSSYIPLYVRAGLEGSPGLTAWSVLPLTVGWTIGAITSSRLADRHSESWIILLGFMVNIPALGLAWYLAAADSPLAASFAVYFVVGVGAGLATNAALTLLRSVTEASRMGRVSSAYLFSRNQGFTFGAAIGGAVLLYVVTRQLGDVELVRDLISSPEGEAPPGAAAAVRDGFAAAIAVGMVISTAGLLAAVRLRRALTSARGLRRGTTPS
jgi:MFS family permease